MRFYEVPEPNIKWDPPEAPLSTREWDSLALQVYDLYYNFIERSTEETRELRLRIEWLKENAPEGRSAGVHLIGPGQAFMGEDVYCVDGTPTHTLHVYCVQCRRPNLVKRRGSLWCANCNQFVESFFPA